MADGNSKARGLAIAAPAAPTVSSTIRRDEGPDFVFFEGPLRDIIAARVANPEWFEDETRQRMRQGKPITIRKRWFRIGGRRITTEILKSSERVRVWIDRTDAEREAYTRREAERREQRQTEDVRRAVDEALAEVAAMTPAAWKTKYAEAVEKVVAQQLAFLIRGTVKRVSEGDGRRLLELAEQLCDAIRESEVITDNDDRPAPRPALRLVVIHDESDAR